jgi:GINS complex subunit 1
MYGRKAVELLQELASGEKEQFARFNNDLVEQVLEECNEHHFQLETRLRKIQEEGLDVETTRNQDHFGAVVHHLSLMRDKRCLMSYMYNRAQIIQSLRWKLGAVLPEEIQMKLSYSEKEYFKSYSEILGSHMSELDLDLTVDMIPPKDPYIKVRVVDDIGEVLLDDQSTSLIRNSMHLMKRTEAETFVSQGLMEEFIE